MKQIQAVLPLMKTTLANSMLDDHQSCSAAIIQSTKNSVTSWHKEKCLLKERIAEADRINIEVTKQLVKERENSASTAAQVLEFREKLMSAEGKYTSNKRLYSLVCISLLYMYAYLFQANRLGHICLIKGGSLQLIHLLQH